MNRLPIIFLTLTTLCLQEQAASAGIITFDFALTSSGAVNQAGVDLDGDNSGTSMATDGTVIATLSATSANGTFNYVSNASTTDFGVNASSGGDESDAFDDTNGDATGLAESMTFSFTTSVPSTISFVSIDFDRISGSGASGEDVGSLVFSSGGSTFTFNGGTVNGSDLLTVNETITSGQSITLSWVDGNGFGLEQITLDVTPIAVPEPSSALMLLFMCGMMVAFKRRRVATV